MKLGQALTKLAEEDPSITIVHNPETHEVVLWGQGEMHLRVATERLSDRYGVAIDRHQPSVGYRETIRKGIVQRGRHKKQSGGHGQYGDVVLDIKPMPRGSGFSFEEKITGGVVPRNYIPSVEEGVIDALKHGPLGFPVVDLQVALIDGSYQRWIPPTWRSAQPAASAFPKACPNASRCCLSRSIWSRSSARPKRRRKSMR